MLLHSILMVLAALVVMCMPITVQEDAAADEAKRKKKQEAAHPKLPAPKCETSLSQTTEELDLIEAGPEMRRF